MLEIAVQRHAEEAQADAALQRWLAEALQRE
jgi:hypothetical protein